MKRKFALLLLGLCTFSLANAQKKPIDHSVYDSWKNISSPQISKSGNLIIYSVTPQEGDGQGFLKNDKNQLLIQIPRGTNLTLTDDEKNLISLIKAPFQEIRQAKIKKKKPDEMPKDSLLVYSINHSTSKKFSQVKSFKTSLKGNEYIAFLSESTAPTVQDSSKTTSSNKKEKPSSVLTLMNLNTSDTINIQKADTYEWSDDGKFLVYSIKSDQKDSLNESGLYIFDLTNKSRKKISNGKADYKNVKFDDVNKQLIFLADKTPEKSLLSR